MCNTKRSPVRIRHCPATVVHQCDESRRADAEHTDTTPARLVLGLRLAAARRRPEESPQGLDRIAEETGLGSADLLRRAFDSAASVTPSEYRARFLV